MAVIVFYNSQFNHAFEMVVTKTTIDREIRAWKKCGYKVDLFYYR